MSSRIPVIYSLFIYDLNFCSLSSYLFSSSIISYSSYYLLLDISLELCLSLDDVSSDSESMSNRSLCEPINSLLSCFYNIEKSPLNKLDYVVYKDMRRLPGSGGLGFSADPERAAPLKDCGFGINGSLIYMLLLHTILLFPNLIFYNSSSYDDYALAQAFPIFIIIYFDQKLNLN